MRKIQRARILRASILPLIALNVIVLLSSISDFKTSLSSLINNSTLSFSALLIFGILIGVQLAKNHKYFSTPTPQKRKVNEVNISAVSHKEYPEQQAYYYQLMIEREIWKLENIRGWISYELHEDIAQILVAAKNHLQTDLHTNSSSSSNIERAGQILEEAIKKVKILYEKLEVPPLKLMGLMSCLQKKIDRETKNGITKIILENKKGYVDELDESLMLAVYRIISEKINNIIKHSKAKNAYIQVEQQVGEIKIKVIDDGVGFYNSKRYWKNGIHMINTMVSSLGGTFTIKSAPGRGCEFIALIPTKGTSL
jgi:two-component system NarL family sensor kinase